MEAVGSKKGGTVSKKLHRGGIALNCPFNLRTITPVPPIMHVSIYHTPPRPLLSSMAPSFRSGTFKCSGRPDKKQVSLDF